MVIERQDDREPTIAIVFLQISKGALYWFFALNLAVSHGMDPHETKVPRFGASLDDYTTRVTKYDLELFKRIGPN